MVLDGPTRQKSTTPVICGFSHDGNVDPDEYWDVLPFRWALNWQPVQDLFWRWDGIPTMSETL